MDIISRESAANASMTRYFTGQPCKHGHIAQRFVANTGCVECANPAEKRSSKLDPEKLEIEKRKIALRERTAAIKEEELRVRELNRITREGRRSFVARQAEDRANQRTITANRRQSKAEMKEIHLMMRDPNRLLDLKMIVWGTAVIRVPTIVLADVYVRSRHDSLHTVRCFVEDEAGLIQVAKELESDFEARLHEQIAARRALIEATPIEDEDAEYNRRFPEGDPR